ncbi:hypothetical protein GGF31_006042 [Allomyces arbusculus]|nr:hypothetical protein GGF31_006042 [Allomyces arbusculus]
MMSPSTINDIPLAAMLTSNDIKPSNFQATAVAGRGAVAAPNFAGLAATLGASSPMAGPAWAVPAMPDADQAPLALAPAAACHLFRFASVKQENWYYKLGKEIGCSDRAPPPPAMDWALRGHVLGAAVDDVLDAFAATPLADHVAQDPADVLDAALEVHFAKGLHLVRAAVTHDGVMLARLVPVHDAKDPAAGDGLRTPYASPPASPVFGPHATIPPLHLGAPAVVAPAAAPAGASAMDAFRASVVALLELAEDTLHCTQLIVCVDPAEAMAIKALRYVGFELVAPSSMAHDPTAVTLLAYEL